MGGFLSSSKKPSEAAAPSPAPSPAPAPAPSPSSSPAPPTRAPATHVVITVCCSDNSRLFEDTWTRVKGALPLTGPPPTDPKRHGPVMVGGLSVEGRCVAGLDSFAQACRGAYESDGGTRHVILPVVEPRGGRMELGSPGGLYGDEWAMIRDLEKKWRLGSPSPVETIVTVLEAGLAGSVRRSVPKDIRVAPSTGVTAESISILVRKFA